MNKYPLYKYLDLIQMINTRAVYLLGEHKLNENIYNELLNIISKEISKEFNL